MIIKVTMSQDSQQFEMGYKPKIIFLFGLKLSFGSSHGVAINRVLSVLKVI